MPGPCKFCRGKETGAKAFLLTCSRCSASWHHNCHTPALSAVELTALLKASNRDDHIRGIQSWTCNRCLNQRNSTAVQGIFSIDDSDDDIMIIAEKLTLPNQGETILDLTMSDDDGVAVEIADNSPIVIDSDPASIRGSSISSPTMDNRQQTLNKTTQRPAQNSSLVNPFMEWLNMDKMSPFAVEADRAWSKRKAVTRRTHRPRKATARELDSAANYTFFFTNL